MTAILLFSLISSLAIVAIYVCVHWDGMILNWSLPYLERLPVWLQKPVYDCMICMSGIWTVLFWLLSGRVLNMDLIVAVMVTAGINTLISIYINRFSE